MEVELKVVLGKMLGEIYKLQEETYNLKNEIHQLKNEEKYEQCQVGRGKIYGLLHGIEETIEEELKRYTITKTDLKNMATVLSSIFKDKEKLEAFYGYYSIEDELNVLGIDRGKAIVILDYFNLNGEYRELIEKMDSDGSPGELRTFEE